MKHTFLYCLLFAFGLLAACHTDSSAPASGGSPLRLLTDDNPAWQYENLRLYPVLADAALATQQSGLSQMKTLSEGMKMPGFRITEQKMFGRSDERSYQILTVQNKSRDTIFLMSGDVVTGGKQDRVIAQDQIVAPHTVRNIDVYCVEKDRWNFSDTAATPQERAICAFRGYYNVASPQVRRAAQRGDSQSAVWSAVARVTSANGADSHTSTYAALEGAPDSKSRRDAYLQHLAPALKDLPHVVGVVAVSGDQVIGVDVFGHPDLFRRAFPALLHGWAVEAAASGAAPVLGASSVQAAFAQVARLSDPQAAASKHAGRLHHKGRWVHLYGM
ncbi:MAG TPA: hypothetical protein PK971_12985 [Saprospiraceae bacterium]|nr:hypothetical protein [Saprospiraceae bacterium]HND89242.1 hypothetical protein [Saprospiraceae bacterium]